MWGKMLSSTLRIAGALGNGISIPNSSTFPLKPGRRTMVSMPLE